MKQFLTFVQSNDNATGLKKTLLLLIKLVVTFTCFYFMASRLTTVAWTDITLSMASLGVLSMVILLMPVNWFLEALRWKYSLTTEQISTLDSLKAVLSGLALNWVMPFTSGDVLSRLANTNSPIRSAQALLINRVFISVVTLLFGSVAVLSYLEMLDFWYLWLLVGFVCLFIVVSFIWLIRLKWQKVIGLTLLRYVIFVLQFWLLLKLYLPVSDSSIFLGIGWIYLFRTFVPSLFGNFGVREASAMFFFEGMVDNMSLVLVPCMLIWLINTVIPSIAGGMFIFDLKFKLAQ